MNYLNESGGKITNVTNDIIEESDMHLVIIKSLPPNLFNTAFIDKESKGRKVGLKNNLSPITAGKGLMQIILRHQPPVNGNEIKDGINESIGSTDSDVSFPIVVK